MRRAPPAENVRAQALDDRNGDSVKAGPGV